MLTTSQLQCNLLEILDAQHQKDGEPLSLIPSFFGSGIYYEKRGYGIFLGKFWSFLKIIGLKEEFQNECLIKSIRATHHTFHKEIQNILTISSDYQNSLLAPFKKEDKAPLISKSSYRKLSIWKRDMHTITKSKRSLQTINRVCTKILRDQAPPLTYSDDIEITYQIFTLQKILGSKIPFNAFAQYLKQAQHLKQNHLKNKNKEIQAFYQRLARSSQYIDPNALHAIISFIVTRSLKSPHPMYIGQIEKEIQEVIPDLFLIPNLKYQKWLNKVKNREITMFGPYKILNEIMGHNHENNQFLIFECDNSENHEHANLCFPKLCPAQLTIHLYNESYFMPNSHKFNDTAHFPHYSNCLEGAYDPYGKWAVYPKLHCFVDQFKWANYVNHKNNNIFRSLIALIQAMCHHQITFSNLNCKSLMCNAAGYLFWVKFPGELKKFDFLQVELFIFKCAQRNFKVFAFLMKISGLFESKNPMINYLKSVIDAAERHKSSHERGLNFKKLLIQAGDFSSTNLSQKIASGRDLYKYCLAKKQAHSKQEKKTFFANLQEMRYILYSPKKMKLSNVIGNLCSSIIRRLAYDD